MNATEQYSSVVLFIYAVNVGGVKTWRVTNEIKSFQEASLWSPRLSQYLTENKLFSWIFVLDAFGSKWVKIKNEHLS